MIAAVLMDSPVSQILYREALLLSHLARSVLAESCGAVVDHTGRQPSPPNPETCIIDPQYMTRYGDQTTLETMGKLYRSIATAIGDTARQKEDISLLFPATAAGRAFDLVGMITGNPPDIDLVGDREAVPVLERYLSTSTTATRPTIKALPVSTSPEETKRSAMTGLIVGALALAGGIGVGWMLARR